MLMTMEMWWLGFYMDPLRLAIYILLNIPMLVGLSYFAGFEATTNRLEDVLDAFTAYAVGFTAAALVLLLFAIIGPGMSADEIIGKIAIQAVPASIGAMLARSQFGERQPEEEEKRRTHDHEGLFLTAVGALYLSSTVAPTEELALLAFKMTPWHIIALLLFSLAVTHAFVLATIAEGKAPTPPGDMPKWTVFFHFTIVGYTVALVVSLYILWTFGRTDGLTGSQVIEQTVVLGFPAALGAGAARLIL